MIGDQRSFDISKQLTERLDIHLALQAAELGVWEVNLLTNQVLWDGRCCQLFGIDQNQLSYPDTLQHIHPQDVEQVNQAVQWALNPQSDGSYQVTYRSIGQDGRTHWIRSTGRRYVDQRGQPVRLTGVAQELTQQVEAQQQEAAALQHSEDRFRTLIQEAPVATCLFVGRQMVIEVANQAMIQVWGKGPDVIGLPLAEALPELKQQHFLTTLDELFTTGKTYQSKGGRADLVIQGQLQTFYFNYDFKPLRTPEGEVYAILETAQDVTQQVLAQQRIEQSQQELLTLFEQSPVGLATISADDQLVFEWVNAFYGQLVARPPQTLVGKPLLEALPEIKGQGFDAILTEVIQTGTAFVAQEVAVDILRDGQLTTSYVDFTYQPRKNPDGTVAGILVVAIDVTQQVLARQQIEASEARLRSVIATAPAVMGLFVGRDLIVELPNQTFIDIVGKGPDIAGKPLREVMPELVTENQPFLQTLDEVYTSGQMFQSPGSRVSIVQQGVMIHKYYNITYTPLRNEHGAVYAILDIAIDVTAQIDAQQSLARSEQHLELLQNTVPAMIFYLDNQQRYQSYNKVFMEWFSVDENEVLGKTVRAFLGETAYKLTEPQLRKAYAGQPVQYELFSPSRMRADRWLSIVYTPHLNEENQVIGLIVHATDVTYSKQIELDLSHSEANYRALAAELEMQVVERTEELAKTNQELSSNNEALAEANRLLMRSNENLQQFAFVASHDLQEPLRKIQQFGDLLKTRYTDSVGEELLYIERMQVAASRMSTLIKDLLNFSRISTRREANSPVSLDNVVSQVLATLELPIAETGAQISLGPLPTVMGDASQLNQLFQNLLSNALKFRRTNQAGVPVAPHILIESSWQAADELPEPLKLNRVAIAYHRIDVADNGIGFDEKYLGRIFQVFQRLHGKAEFAGTGIGLAICEKVVANHGGAITASSQPGQGATFTVYLPASLNA
ncbi:PAS domain-containing protein [Spirosoma luteum]|uniref:PAS domain-containing protein n=1 Tax=Spirosoma luteum TaxID=431553 RepID=UPI00037A0809|nr:PAS domain-containing protein [Spirosoma luteum]